MILVLTRSDSVIIREARTFLTGRRGRASRVDFHLYPLSFSEYRDVSGIAGHASGHPLFSKSAVVLIDAFRGQLMYGQVTWNSLARDLSIDHPTTVADYFAVLSRMDVLIVQHALREDRLRPAPNKARKVAFFDPLFFMRCGVGSTEVDIAYVTDGGFQPVEVKWTGQIRSADLKQARKYPNSIICSKIATSNRIHGLRNELLPLHLQRLGQSPHYVTW